MEIFCWFVMPSDVHLIFRAKENNPSQVLGRFKEHTSKQLSNAIESNGIESRREWILWMMKRAALKNSSVSKVQFWQHHNKPIEFWSGEVIEQNVNYIHGNAVKAGFVVQADHWKYSSAFGLCNCYGSTVISHGRHARASWEYMDSNGKWHNTSTLKPGKAGNTNPNYNPDAAKKTHISVPSN